MKRVSLLKSKSSPTVATLLGEVSMAWSQLEFSMQIFISLLTELDTRVASVFTYRAGMEKWLEWSQHIIALRYRSKPDAMGDWEVTMAALRAAQRQRNSLVHALLTSSPDRNGIKARKVVQKGKNGNRHLKPEYPIISIGDLRTTLRTIDSGSETLLSWQLSHLLPIGAANPTLPPLT